MGRRTGRVRNRVCINDECREGCLRGERDLADRHWPLLPVRRTTRQECAVQGWDVVFGCLSDGPGPKYGLLGLGPGQLGPQGSDGPATNRIHSSSHVVVSRPSYRLLLQTLLYRKPVLCDPWWCSCEIIPVFCPPLKPPHRSFSSCPRRGGRG